MCNNQDHREMRLRDKKERREKERTERGRKERKESEEEEKKRKTRKDEKELFYDRTSSVQWVAKNGWVGNG